jgi:hypothetical protein
MLTRRRSRYPLAVAAIVAVMAMMLAGCKTSGRPGTPKSGGKTQPPQAGEADFKVEARAVDPKDRPDAGQKATDAGTKVAKLLNDYYTIAFLDPDKWEKGTHPDLKSLFTTDAQGQVGANLGGLALADIAPQLESVTGTKQEAKVSFSVDDDGSLPVGVATVTFEATGTPSKGKDGPVSISHNATFWLALDGDSYKISAYTTELKADTATTSASGGDQ